MSAPTRIARLEAAGSAPAPGTGQRHGPVLTGGRRGWLVVLAAALAWSLWDAGVGTRQVLNVDGAGLAGDLLAGAVRPELSGTYLSAVVEATLVTVAYAVLATAIAVGLGLVGALTLARTPGRWHRVRARRVPAGWLAGRAALALPRGVHEAVWALVLVNVLGADPLVAVLAIGVPFGAITAKVYADLLDEVRPEPHRAVRASGAPRLAAAAYALLPAAAGDMATYGFYRLDCAVRAAVVLGVVGAGGLGQLLQQAFADLSSGRMWTCVYALALVCAAAEAVSAWVRRGRRLAPVVAGGLGLVAWSWWYVGIAPSTLWSARAREQAAYVLERAWPPSLDGTSVGQLVRLSLETLQMSVLAAAGATAAAVLVAPLAARPPTGAGAARRLVGTGCRALLLLCRAVPAVVWALVLLFVLLPGPLPGALALGVYNFGVLGRLCAEALENADSAAADALRASGAAGVPAYAYATFPQLLPRFLAYGLYRWEIAARETVVVGLVGGGGLGYLLARQVAAFDWQGATATVLCLVALALLIDLVSARVRAVLR